MRIPINWLEEHIKLPKKLSDLTDKLTMVGHMLDKIDIVNGNSVIDLELRGNRADCYSILGIAREISAIYKARLKKLPIIPVKSVKKLADFALDIKTPLVKRVGMIEIKNVKITKSPKWLSEKLTAYGMESINNIVDLTNYVMIETGEPMHAFDLDKVGKNLEIRLAKNGEKMTTFQGSVVTTGQDDLVWTKKDIILSIAGSIGEKYNSISETTTNILLEAANYDRANIRKTVYRHKLFTEAGIRHEKELDPNMVDFAISRFLYIIKNEGWGKFEPVIFDYYPKQIKPWRITLNLDYLNRLSGTTINLSEIKTILKNLQFNLISANKDNLVVEIPTYRTDVKLEEDLIEEIVRIYGYDKIPTKTLSLEIPKSITPPYIIQEQKIRDAAISIGFDENISLSFVREDYKENSNVFVINAPSPDTKYLRGSLFDNLLDTANKVINERGEELKLFEVGKIYLGKKDKYKESRKLGLIYWSKEKNTFSDFKLLVNSLFLKLNIKEPNYVPEIFDTKFVNSYLLKIENKEIGFGGMYEDIFYCEIDLDSILNTETKYQVKLWPKFPPQVEDITLQIPDKTYVGEVEDYIKNFDKQIANVSLKNVYESSYTFNIEYQNPSQTLSDKEVEEIRKRLTTSLKTKFGIVIN